MRSLPRRSAGRWLSLFVVFAMLAPLVLGCTPPATPAGGWGAGLATSGEIRAPGGASGGAVQGETSGLTFTLGEGTTVPPAPEINRLVAGEPLSEGELQALPARGVRRRGRAARHGAAASPAL